MLEQYSLISVSLSKSLIAASGGSYTLSIKVNLRLNLTKPMINII